MKLNELVLTKEEIIQAIDRQSEKEGLSRTTIYFYGSEAVSLATVKKVMGYLEKHKVRTGAQKGWHISFSEATWQEIYPIYE